MQAGEGDLLIVTSDAPGLKVPFIVLGINVFDIELPLPCLLVFDLEAIGARIFITDYIPILIDTESPQVAAGWRANAL